MSVPCTPGKDDSEALPGAHTATLDKINLPTSPIASSLCRSQPLPHHCAVVRPNFPPQRHQSAPMLRAHSLVSGPWIKELWLFPVAGCLGERVSTARLMAPSQGFEYDDEWLIVENEQGGLKPLACQQAREALAIIKCTIESHSLVLAAPGIKPLSLPLAREGNEQTLSVNGEGAAVDLPHLSPSLTLLMTAMQHASRSLSNPKARPPPFHQSRSSIFQVSSAAVERKPMTG